jgi:hypothetical protein
LPLDGAFEVINLVIGGVCSDHDVFLLDDPLDRLHLLSHDAGLAQFPIGFSVQLICPNEHSALPLCRVEKQAISRESLILMNFQNVTNTDIRTRLHVPRSALLQVFVHRVVDILVFSEPLDVVESFFNHCDCEHEHQRRNVRKHEAHFEGRVKLGHRDQQEEHIVEELELVVQNDGQKGENVVFRVVLAISHEAAGRCLTIQSDLTPFP